MAREKFGLINIIRAIPDAIAWELEKRLNRTTLNLHRPEYVEGFTNLEDGHYCIRCQTRWPCPEAKAVLDRIQHRNTK